MTAQVPKANAQFSLSLCRPGGKLTPVSALPSSTKSRFLPDLLKGGLGNSGFHFPFLESRAAGKRLTGEILGGKGTKIYDTQRCPIHITQFQLML